MPTDLQTAIHDAAVAVLEHAGPERRTDPHIPVNAMSLVLDLGGTHDDIAQEIQRIRDDQS